MFCHKFVRFFLLFLFFSPYFLEKKVLVVFHLVIKYKKLSHNSDSLCSFFFFLSGMCRKGRLVLESAFPVLKEGNSLSVLKQGGTQ